MPPSDPPGLLYDVTAERHTIAHALTSPHGYDLADLIVGAADFYDPTLRRIWTHLEAAPVLPTQPGRLLDERLTAVARTSGIRRRHLERLVASRPLMWDTSGRYPRRVAMLADRRRRLALLEDERAALLESR